MLHILHMALSISYRKENFFSNCHESPQICSVYLLKKNLCKWTHAVQTHDIRGLSVPIHLLCDPVNITI